jgi:peptidyl-tRNA hydrolase
MLEKVSTEKFVLQKFNKEEQESLEDVVKKSAEIVVDSLKNGVEHTSI